MTCRVKKWTPPSCRGVAVAGKSEAFQPPKEKNAIGTGIGTLMPTMPTSTSFWKRAARHRRW